MKNRMLFLLTISGFMVTISELKATASGDQRIINAACRNNLPLVEKLIKEGVDVNATDRYGDTALMIASMYGYMDIVQALLNVKGIDVTAFDAFRKTALMYAKSAIDEGWDMNGDYKEIVQALKAAAKQLAALINAASQGNLVLVQTLISQGADVNATDSNRNTALISAAYAGYIDIVQALIKAPKINLEMANSRGLTALVAATAGNHLDVVNALLKVLITPDLITPLQLATNLKYTTIVAFFNNQAVPQGSVMIKRSESNTSGRTYAQIAGETVHILNNSKTEAGALTVIQSMSWPLVGLSINIPVSKESAGW